ncbi:hypothetical protein A4H97_13915 [Niastella yeongjuensis]|uniref:Uncharacterized protein n=1 Tax=Niastella yeongjuensis TaxID=354355 RepID=A0A1V9E475_9BACT|nr:hypothetical protein [Niastella yeongjuensis]OQP40715.1 hypothetical protein A4H97_13915 [Niastella yeongjuensis]
MKKQSLLSILSVGMVLALGIAIVGCGSSTCDKPAMPLDEVTGTAQTNDSTLQVFVASSGKITANGLPVDLTMLDSALGKLKNVHGKVFYSRENLQADPPAESMKIMDLVVKYELPVKFYIDKAFTKTADVK